MPSAASNAVAIAVVAPGRTLERRAADRISALAAARFGNRMRLSFHPQCFLEHGHFAGDDKARSDAFLEVANDPAFDAVWFARGGYGACRLSPDLWPRLDHGARAKTYLGYSDAGFILGRLFREGFAHLAHGPMPADIARNGGEQAILRALDFFLGDERGVCPMPKGVGDEAPCLAFNLTVLIHLLASKRRPDLSGRVLFIEEVSEHHYQIDRACCALAGHDTFAASKGLALGRCSDIPTNDVDFGAEPEEIARYWCRRVGVPYLGRVDIGHDADNKIVRF